MDSGFVFMYGSTATPGSHRDTEILFLSKNGEIEKSFSMTTDGYAYLTKCEYLDNNTLFLAGGKRFRSFAESSIWITKFSPNNPLYRFYSKSSTIPLFSMAPYQFTKGSTTFKKEALPISVEAKDLVVPFREKTVDFQ